MRAATVRRGWQRVGVRVCTIGYRKSAPELICHRLIASTWVNLIVNIETARKKCIWKFLFRFCSSLSTHRWTGFCKWRNQMAFFPPHIAHAFDHSIQIQIESIDVSLLCIPFRLVCFFFCFQFNTMPLCQLISTLFDLNRVVCISGNCLSYYTDTYGYNGKWPVNTISLFCVC